MSPGPEKRLTRMPQLPPDIVKGISEEHFIVYLSHQCVNRLHHISSFVRKNPVRFTVAVAGVGLAVIPAILLPILGFGALGPAAGSVAAAWQASMGNVAAGSLFALLQSAGMGGAAAGIFTGVGVIGGAFTVGAVASLVLGKLGVSINAVAAAVKDAVGNAATYVMNGGFEGDIRHGFDMAMGKTKNFFGALFKKE